MVPVLLMSCVTLDMFHNFSGLSLLFCEMGLVMGPASEGCCEEINLILIKGWNHAWHVSCAPNVLYCY